MKPQCPEDQFVVFNTVFLVILSYISRVVLKYHILLKEEYDILFRYFLVASFVFFMAFQIPYSDRWGLFSWITIPILMAPVFTFSKTNMKFKTPIVLFFMFIYVFFQVYGS